MIAIRNIVNWPESNLTKSKQSQSLKTCRKEPIIGELVVFNIM